MTAVQYILSSPVLTLTQILIHGNSMFMCLGKQTITFENGLAGPWLGMDGGWGGVFWHRQSNRKYKVCSVTASSRTTYHHV